MSNGHVGQVAFGDPCGQGADDACPYALSCLDGTCQVSPFDATRGARRNVVSAKTAARAVSLCTSTPSSSHACARQAAARRGCKAGQVGATVGARVHSVPAHRVPMRNSSFPRGWRAVAATAFCLCGCSKPQPNAPTQEFSRRHQCPASAVQTVHEGADRMRLTGCGVAELYVRSCVSPGVASPASEARQPVSEEEARYSSSAQPPSGGPGCAWSRKQNMPASGTGGAPLPKWLSDP
jgi:hypothetical protein